MENNEFKQEPDLNEVEMENENKEFDYSELEERLPFDDEPESENDKEETDKGENPFENEEFLEGLEE